MRTRGGDKAYRNGTDEAVEAEQVLLRRRERGVVRFHVKDQQAQDRLHHGAVAGTTNQKEELAPLPAPNHLGLRLHQHQKRCETQEIVKENASKVSSRGSRTPSNLSKVLVLGCSYADKQSPSVDEVVDMVRRKALSEIDGRDLARCRAMELLHKVDAYTVSLETGGVYKASRHYHADFNARGFVRSLLDTFDSVVFHQIILDYFWSPGGAWAATHWKPAFFCQTLPDFVKLGMLEFSENAPESLGHGVYIPFCFNCLKEIMAGLSVLSKYYQISFVHKTSLREHALWSGTARIDPQDMLVLGKEIGQEEIYCTLSFHHVRQAMDDSRIRKDMIKEVMMRINDIDNLYSAPRIWDDLMPLRKLVASIDVEDSWVNMKQYRQDIDRHSFSAANRMIPDVTGYGPKVITTGFVEDSGIKLTFFSLTLVFCGGGHPICTNHHDHG